MSVVAGCSLFHGVMLIADCRITVVRPGKPDIRCDNAQKLFPLTDTSGIGFVGDLQVASLMLRELLRHIEEKRKSGEEQKLHPLNMLRWLPGFMRFVYSALSQKGVTGIVYFMVGSVVPGLWNLIERQKVVEIMERLRLGTSPIQRSWIPGILVEILKTPPSSRGARLEGVPRGVLYRMDYPDFRPKLFKPLEYAAIGIGEEVVTSTWPHIF